MNRPSDARHERRMWPACAVLLLRLTLPPAAAAQTDSTLAGGPGDRPLAHSLFGAIAVGGYLEANGTWERQDGITTQMGVELTRWNLLASTQLGDHVRVFSEIEFEDGGREVTVELAQIDLLLHYALNVRGGMLLLPLGRFNLAHDGPRNELPRRPFYATELLGVAIAQPGLGAFGQFGAAEGGRVTYELYGVTGFHDGLIQESPEGTRLPLGRFNPEDVNLSPAWVGRTEWSPSRPWAIAVSGYHGAWNAFRVDGLEVDERRDLMVGVLDARGEVLGVALAAEGALVNVDVPPGLTGVNASRQSGFYAQASRPFGRGWIAAMPESWFTAAARVEAVDFDRDLAGDSFRSLTLGANLRPVRWAAFKLAWMRGETRDRFNNRATVAQMQLGLTSYF